MPINTPRRSLWWIAPSAVVLLATSSCGESAGSSTADRTPVGSSVTPATDAPPITNAAAITTGAPVATEAPVATTTTEATTTTVAGEATGWAIHDALASEQTGAITDYDAVSCESELGPWHIVASFVASGNLTQDVFYDVTLSDSAAGPLTGEEHTTWDGGTKIDGTYVGTATLTASAGGFTLTLDYDESITIVDSVRNDLRPGHRTKELIVGPAAAGDCD